MKTLLILFVGITFLGLAHSADEDRLPCDMPNKWMGSFHSIKIDDNYCLTKGNFGHMRYDFNQKKMRVDYLTKSFKQNDIPMDHLVKGSLYYCFDEGMAYHYKRTNETCTSFKIQNDMMPPNKIPEDSEFLGLGMIGGQTIESWLLTHNKTKSGSVKEFLSFTEDSCLPVSAMTYDAETEKVKWSMQLWNVVPSVPPFSFEIPDICKKAAPQPVILKNEKMGPLGPQIMPKV